MSKASCSIFGCETVVTVRLQTLSLPRTPPTTPSYFQVVKIHFDCSFQTSRRALLYRTPVNTVCTLISALSYIVVMSHSKWKTRETSLGKTAERAEWEAGASVGINSGIQNSLSVQLNCCDRRSRVAFCCCVNSELSRVTFTGVTTAHLTLLCWLISLQNQRRFENTMAFVQNDISLRHSNCVHRCSLTSLTRLPVPS